MGMGRRRRERAVTLAARAENVEERDGSEVLAIRVRWW